MSLNELRPIYRNAASIIRAKYSALPGVDKVLNSLEKRLPKEPADPRVHRDLFFEPRIDSQQLSVPLTTAETVAQQLHKFGLLRLWVRVTCPNTEDGEAGTVLETDDSDSFKQLVASSCDHCGAHHEFSWEDCETVFAVNSSLDESEQHFNYASLRSTLPQVSQNGSVPQRFDLSRCESVLNGGQRDARTTREPALIALALQANHSTLDIPPALSAWWNAWVGPLLLISAYLLLIVPIVRYCGQWIGVLVSVVVLVGLFLAIRGQVQAKLAPTVIQRTALWGGLSLATYCVAVGSTGLHINAEAGQNEPWWSKVAFGELSEPLLYSGIAVYAITLLFVFSFDFQRGWFARAKDYGAETNKSEGMTTT
ncbi:hypothetical protein [Novipirellula artificiosorum]|uniref:Uncharacterized protein n=1 Tax=Novipirellula artificiosorum TaxID=2528016 RepID=A0A5C6DZ73_9BACT|nr:hypothetical protein [Novipirellula artificiosorum]TWU41882.1 hypothetical protein Poly41_01750 [Novipirellula artificiosorum]